MKSAGMWEMEKDEERCGIKEQKYAGANKNP